MPKCSVFNRLLQLRISTCVFSILCIVTVTEFFCSYGLYHYDHISHEAIDSELYKEISPKLILKKSKLDCDYREILRSTTSINNWEVPHKFDDFVVKGLVNGSHVPEECNPVFSVAVLVTYRNRQEQLNVFLPYMHNFLRKQNLHYKIYLIEQQDEKPWNKGLLYNIGAKYAIADKFPCLILHDVDMLPLDESNLYACTRRPRHLSASLDKFRYVLTYDKLVGGVLAITADQYTAVNGFSNHFHGWGGEDDDFYRRIADNKLNVIRFPREMSRYTMLRHLPEPRNWERMRLLRETRPDDGLRAASELYHALVVKPNTLFTLIGVKL